jgi:hypothetical protein
MSLWSRHIRSASLACLAAAPLVSPVSHAQAPPTAQARARAFAALPDWRGVWQNPWWATADASGRVPGTEDDPTAQIIAHTKLMGPGPYNATWEAKRQAVSARMRSSTGPPPPGKVCVVPFPGMMESPETLQIVVTPEETLILAADGRVRHIYTDGRRHPTKDDLWPTPTGDSIGHWEGKTLVIDTIAHTAGFAGPFPVPDTIELSQDARFTERLHQIDPNTLEDDMTIEDPARFTQAWRVKLRYVRLAIDRMIADDCGDNDRIEVINGRQVVAPALPH